MKIPPPILMNNAIRLTNSYASNCDWIEENKYKPAIAMSAIAGTARPTVAPPLKAIAKSFLSHYYLDLALTAAFTVIFNEIIPATADNAAPTAKASPFDGVRKTPIIIVNAIATGTIIFIFFFKNAAALL